MRAPRVGNDNRSQGIPPWFLLADCASRSRASSQVLQRLPAIQGEESPPSVENQNNPNNMLICGMGAGHGWTIQNARGGLTHLLVAVDKFTKWIEARPIKKLDGPTTVWFIA